MTVLELANIVFEIVKNGTIWPEDDVYLTNYATARAMGLLNAEEIKSAVGLVRLKIQAIQTAPMGEKIKTINQPIE